MMDNPRISIPMLPVHAVDVEGILWRVNAKSRSSRTLVGVNHDKPLKPRKLEEIAVDLGRRHSLVGAVPQPVIQGLWEMRYADAPPTGWQGNIIDFLRRQVPAADAMRWFIIENHLRDAKQESRQFLATHGDLLSHARERLPYIIAGQLLYTTLCLKYIKDT